MPEKGAWERGKCPSYFCLRVQGGSEVPFLNCVCSILATIFQPENKTKGTLCSKLTEIQLIALFPYQYKAST